MRPYLFQKMPRVECLGHESPDDVHGKPDICVLRSFPRKQRKEGCQNRHGRPARIDGNGRVGYKLHGQQNKPTGRSREGKKNVSTPIPHLLENTFFEKGYSYRVAPVLDCTSKRSEAYQAWEPSA